MPKMKALLSDFIRWGKVGAFGLGVEQADVRDVLGAPESDEPQLGTLVSDVYGDVEFEFSRVQGAVLIMVSLTEERGPIEFEDREAYSRMGYAEFVDHLGSSGIAYEHRSGSDHPTKDSSFFLETGVQVTIGDEFVTTMAVVDVKGLRAARKLTS